MTLKCKLVIKTMVSHDGTTIEAHEERSEVWRGELELPDNVYLMKVSLIGEGLEHPIVDVPFSATEGHWRWFPPSMEEGEIPKAGHPTAPLFTALREEDVT